MHAVNRFHSFVPARIRLTAALCIGASASFAPPAAHATTQAELEAKVQALALRVVADRLEHGEAGPDLIDISFNAA